MQKIRYQLDDIESCFSRFPTQPLEIPQSNLTLLPDNIRKTYLAVSSRGECNATEVSNLTGRSRVVESKYLNQLVRMGWLTKQRDSKTINFGIP